MSASHGRWPVRCQNNAVVVQKPLTASDTLMFEGKCHSCVSLWSSPHS